MEVRRLSPRYVVVGLLLGLVLSAPPVQAQERVPFALRYGGGALPAGTVLVVLAEPAEATPAGRIQPRFLAPDAYPLDAATLRRDTLDAAGTTRARYARTQAAATRYFLYARTPADALYWSYSTTKDSLKFDTVETGRMAVVPIRDAAVREQVVRALFDVPAAAVEVPAPAEAAAPPPESATAPESATIPPAATLPAAGTTVPRWLFVLLLGLALLLLTGLLYTTRHYRRRLRGDAASAPPARPPDAPPPHESDLAELRGKHERLQKTYNVLLARHKTLLREVQRLQQDEGVKRDM